MSDSLNSIPLRHTAELTQALRNGQEVAIVDLREEADFGTGHPLFATNLPLSKLEIEVLDRIPRRSTTITLYDNGQRYNPRTGTRLAEVAYQRLKALGYVDVALLAGDLAGWKEAGVRFLPILIHRAKPLPRGPNIIISLLRHKKARRKSLVNGRHALGLSRSI